MFDTTPLKQHSFKSDTPPTSATSHRHTMSDSDEVIDLCSDSEPAETVHRAVDKAVYDDEATGTEQKPAAVPVHDDSQQEYEFEPICCLNCNEDFEQFSDAYTHPVLGLPVCKDCHEYVSSYDLDTDLDEDGDRQYCTWCVTRLL